MAIELIAAIVAAIACAGIALALRKLSRGRLPVWIVPVAAGLGLIGFTVWSEYDWYGRVSGELPEGVAIYAAPAEVSGLRPWTMFAPLVTRFWAIDHRATVVNPDNPSIRSVREIAVRRWAGAEERMIIVDCTAARRALLTDAVAPGPGGTMTGAEWEELPADDPFLTAACGAN